MRTARTLMSNVEAVEATKQLRNTRPGGHRIENVPLTEYQMFQSNMMLPLSPRYGAWNGWHRHRSVDSPGLSTRFWPFLHDQNQLGSDDPSGKVKQKVEPLPISLSTQILPPCSSTNFLANVNPSPVPSLL